MLVSVMNRQEHIHDRPHGNPRIGLRAQQGYESLMDLPAEFAAHPHRAASGDPPKPAFWTSGATPNQPPIHVASRVDNRHMVDDFHAAALAAGGRCNGEPGLRPHYHDDYYAAFVLDPDGHNIEAVCHLPPA